MIDGKPTVMVGTPMYGGVAFMEYIDSLIRNVGYLKEQELA